MSRDTKFVHLAWQRDEKLLEKVKYPMGSDPTGRICRLFGVMDEASGLSLRGTFLINPQGTIMNSEVNFYNLGRNVEEILRKVIANKHLAANPVEAPGAVEEDRRPDAQAVSQDGRQGRGGDEEVAFKYICK